MISKTFRKPEHGATGWRQHVPSARVVVLIAKGLLFFLVGFPVADGRAEAKALLLKLEAARINAEAARRA